MKRQKIKTLFEHSPSLKRLVIVVISFISLAGCQAVATPNETSDTQQSEVMVEEQGQVRQSNITNTAISSSNTLSGGGVLQTCLRELEALKRVHEKRYQAKSGDLNRVLTQAKSYMELRDNLNSDTVAIMDSAYQFKISRTCNSVRTELTRTLLERLEAL